MAKYPNKAKTPIAIHEYTHQDLSCCHVTTSNFMEFSVAKRIAMVPKQSINIKHQLFSRMDPLALPTFGNAKIHNRLFFVPYRTVMPAWNDFIEDTVHSFSGSSSARVPFAHRIKNSQFVYFLMYTTNSEEYPACSIDITSKVANDSNTAFDFCVITSQGPKYYNFTPYGSRCLKLFQQLGYGIDFNLKNTEIYHSALPLLSLGKIYMDWYYQNQYIDDEWAMTVRNILDYDSTVDFADYMSSGNIGVLMRVITKVNYDSDYFVSSWDNPVGPSNGTMSEVQIKDITGSNALTLAGYDVLHQTPEIQVTTTGSSSNRISLTDYALKSLRRLNDYVKRHQIAGARVLDRYLARFGVTLSAEKLKRSNYLGGFNQDINFGDVTSTASTDGATLGAYAGKGISFGQGDFNFTTDEYGDLIIITTIVPKTSYFQGQDKTTMQQTRLDFWTPEFDSMGVQSQDTRELFMPMDARQQYPEGTTTYNSLNYNGYVFGFVPRYAEYKIGRDQITGDYRLGSRNTGKDAWTLFRDVTPLFANLGIAGTKHDRQFTTGADSMQYNRIFSESIDDSIDHFYMIHQFNIDSKFPGKSLYDSYEFEDEDKAQKVDVDVNGVKAN